MHRREFLRTAPIYVGGLLAGCRARSTLAPSRPVTLRFWKSPHSEFERERMGKVIRDFEALHPGIRVEHTITTWETWDETYTSAFAGGHPPDVAYMPDQYYFKFADTGNLADLGAWTESPAYASERKAWFENAWQMGRWEGTQVGLPSFATMFLLYANRRLFETAGLDPSRPPASYDELVEYARRMTIPGGAQWGYAGMTAAVDDGYFAGMQYFHDCGANFLTPSHDGPGFENAGGRTALELLSGMICRFKVQPPHGAFNRAGLLDLFRAGKVGMLMEEISQHGDFKRQQLDFTYDLFLQPPGPVKQTAFGNFGYFVIARRSRQQEAAWQFIRYLTSGPVLQSWAGQHGLVVVRRDASAPNVDPLFRKAQTEFAPRIEGFQRHARLRQIVTAMWSEFEGSFAGQRGAAESLRAAARGVRQALS